MVQGVTLMSKDKGIDYPVTRLCTNIVYGVYIVLGYEKQLARFHGLCDGERTVRKILCGNV